MSRLAKKPYRWFDKSNPLWDNYNRKQNPIFVARVQEQMNDLLQSRGYVTLNEALRSLGFKRDRWGDMVGWVSDPDPEQGDGYIYFGVWDQGMAHGKDWIAGRLDAMTISFNIDRTPESLPRWVRRNLRAEGKI